MRGLYAIADVETLAKAGVSVEAFVEAVLSAKPAAIQLRDKNGGARRTLELLRKIAPLAARAGVPLYANDRPDLAVLAACNGVHVGQDDLPVALARKVGPKLRVGLSTHDEAQAEAAALAEGDSAPDYIAIGPVFATPTKSDHAPPLGIAGLERLAARVRKLRPKTPIVAIGGVTLENAAEVGTIADAVAVIGALAARLSEDQVAERARALHRAIRGDTR